MGDGRGEEGVWGERGGELRVAADDHLPPILILPLASRSQMTAIVPRSPEQLGFSSVSSEAWMGERWTS